MTSLSVASRMAPEERSARFLRKMGSMLEKNSLEKGASRKCLLFLASHAILGAQQPEWPLQPVGD
jgi:hypothetical protein